MYTFMPLSFLASIQQNHTKHYKANWIQRACFNMSDDDDFQMSADEEDFDFEYDDDEEMGDGDANDADQGVENLYYNAKALKEDEPESAVTEFTKIAASESAGEWGFKALKQAIKVQFMLARKEAALKDYSRLMNEELSRPYISKSYAERSVNGMLEFLCCEDRHFMEQIYLNTVNGLEKIGNERALIKTNLKLAKLYIDSHQTDKASEIVSWLSAALEDTATSDSTRGTSLLELYSIHIQLYGETGNTQKLREYYNKALGVTTAIPHPRILGVIREYGGKMHMQEKQWSFAREDFFESFKNYDETGASERVDVLRYYILACILSQSGVNPFESQEIKPYLQMKEIAVMKRLVEIFETSDIEQFNELLRAHRDELTRDKFIGSYLDEIFLGIRCQSVLQIVKPYSKVSVDFLANTLSVSKDDAIKIVTILILDEKLPQARIDAASDTIELRSALYVDSSFIPLSKNHIGFKEADNKILPSRYFESATEQRQMQEQRSVVYSSANSTAIQSKTRQSVQRQKAVIDWLSASRVFHNKHHLWQES